MSSEPPKTLEIYIQISTVARSDIDRGSSFGLRHGCARSKADQQLAGNDFRSLVSRSGWNIVGGFALRVSFRLQVGDDCNQQHSKQCDSD